jgi:glycosyltransferase involved in cell wall biosynthesis
VTSVIIAAHNEAAVIGRCLDSLLAGADPGEFEVVVAANGCTDPTARVATARPGVLVLDLPDAGKARALNAGDAIASGYPRIYLDADIIIDADGIRALRDALTATPRVLAATARRELDLRGSALLVRAYYAINSRLPAYRNALFGRGVIALSAEGRGRFGDFPDVVADDLFLDSLFAEAEKREAASVTTVIAAPRRTAELVRRLTRVRRGNASLRAVAPATDGSTGVPAVARTSWLRDVALRHPSLMPAAACYAAITILAAVRARSEAQPGSGWEPADTRGDDLGTHRREAAGARR